MTADRPVLGIALMVGFCALAPLGDSFAKIIGDSLPLLIVLFVRYAMQALLTPFVILSGGTMALPPRVVKLTALRALLHVTALGAMFMSLRYLELADAIAIAYVMPFILLLLGHFYLGEEVGRRRIIACAVGFVGVLLVVQPSFAEVGLPALLPIVVAVLFSVFMLVTRTVAKEAGPVVLQAASGIIATIGLSVAVILASVFGWIELSWPTPGQFGLLFAVGTLGTASHLLMTASLRFAPSATLAPMQYLEIPFATLIGFVLFDDLPNGLAAVGIAITVSAGLYILFRERRLAAGTATVQGAV
jgi:drug/metabolite transporter (DMT)-like permease